MGAARRCCMHACACISGGSGGGGVSNESSRLQTHQGPLQQQHQRPELKNPTPHPPPPLPIPTLLQLNHLHQLQSSRSPAPSRHIKDPTNQIKSCDPLLAPSESPFSFLEFLQQSCAGRQHQRLDSMIQLANGDVTSVLITAEALERLAKRIHRLVTNEILPIIRLTSGRSHA